MSFPDSGRRVFCFLKDKIMATIARILDIPQVNEKYTVVDREHGQLTLNAWMVRNNETSKKFVVKGILEKDEHDTDVKVFANIDISELRRQEYSEYIDVIINGGNKNDVNDKEIRFNDDNTFSFSIELAVNSWKFADSNMFDTPRRVTLKLNVRTEYVSKKCLFVKKKYATNYEFSNERIFDIFVVKSLENTKTWIGLDPGTSGSCVCMGCSRGGYIQSPNIINVGGIIPSTVIIPQRCPSKNNISDFVPGVDYHYGLKAKQMWKAESENGSGCFSSIKKMLGYNKHNKIQVQMSDCVQEFSGVDIAHLLIKGIYNETENFIGAFDSNDRKKYFGEQVEKPQRVVVAIPNNYTLPKIIDMVESIERLGKYAEIRCIYEPEAILFNYIMKEYDQITSMNEESVMVFDMGGATINTSIYKIDIKTKGDRTRVGVKTIGRIGYAVGGDNIDYALIETLMDIYTNSRCRGNISDEIAMQFKLKNKNVLLQEIFQFKLALIKAYEGYYMDMFGNEVLFLKFINNLFKDLNPAECKPLDIDLLKIILGCKIDTIWDDYRSELVNKIISSEKMDEYVYSRIAESVSDVLAFLEDEHIDKLIFSGRSVLFPKVKSVVKNGVSKYNPQVWNKLNDDEIKSAVARGACWLGMYGTSVYLDNELITSTYGFKKIRNGRETFIPVIHSKNRFDEYNDKYSDKYEINSGFDEEGNNIEFYQVVGANTDDVFTANKKYKLNYIGVEDIDTDTKEVVMQIDRQDNVEYTVVFENGESRRTLGNNSCCEMHDDNDFAYIFATYQPKLQNNEVTWSKTDNTVLSERKKNEKRSRI